MGGIEKFKQISNEYMSSKNIRRKLLRGEVSKKIQDAMGTNGVTVGDIANKLGLADCVVERRVEDCANLTLDELADIAGAIGVVIKFELKEAK